MRGARVSPTMPPTLLEKLVSETYRAEHRAVDHPVREARRLGESPPVLALRDLALHATIARPRFEEVLRGHDVTLHRGSIGTTLTDLRNLVADRVVDAERSFRTVVLDVRHALDVVARLRQAARRDHVFGVIRWCDEWLSARRTLVARVEAQLAWFAERAALHGTRPRLATLPPHGAPPGDAPEQADRTP